MVRVWSTESALSQSTQRKTGSPILANPDPAKSGVNKPPDARPLRASLPRIPTSLALSSAASAALSLRAHLPTAPPFGRALIATAGAPHSPSLAWGSAAWFPASPGRCSGYDVGSQRLERTKRRTTRREGSCSCCCCYCSRRRRRRSPRRGPCPFPGESAPPHGASALGSRVLCVPASARCLWGLAAGRLPWLFQTRIMVMKRGGWEAAAASKAAAKWADPSRRLGLYPRRMECTVRSITACAVLNPEIRTGPGGSQPQFPGCCGSSDTY